MHEDKPEDGLVKPERKLEFFGWCESGYSDPDLADITEKLLRDDDCKKYWDQQGEYFDNSRTSGYTDVPMLEFLNGLPLNNLVLAYVAGLQPTKIRITAGEVTCDCCLNRVTIQVKDVDGQYIVEHIHQELRCGYACGSDVSQVLRFLKQGGEKPKTRSTVFGDVSRLKDADFS